MHSALDSTKHSSDFLTSEENSLEEGMSLIKSHLGIASIKADELIAPLSILKAQTARTEFRGGQAGGISTLDYETKIINGITKFSPNPINVRVRCVARKRYPLADDLCQLFKNSATKLPNSKSSLTGYI